MMKKSELKKLLLKYRAGKCTPDETAFLENWFAQWNQEIPFGLSAEELESDLRAIGEKTPTLQPIAHRFGWLKSAVAASVLLCLSTGAYFLLSKSSDPESTNSYQSDIPPGNNKATLTLANGVKIPLTNAKNGKLAKQAGALIQKVNNGEVVYSTSESQHTKQPAEPQYNVMTTPRGGQYHLILADGTKVWLNAASSIKYPAIFTGKERKVEITGEVYFEVKHKIGMPFRVSAIGQTVEDLGTHFNINAYSDEKIVKTTLLAGSVKIVNDEENVILTPGQESQIIMNASKKICTINNADTSATIAWKNGLFKFHNAGIQAIMRQLSRWYDVDIAYEGNISARTFSGEITRNAKASQVLEMLSYLKINFRIEQHAKGKMIIVTS